MECEGNEKKEKKKRKEKVKKKRRFEVEIMYYFTLISLIFNLFIKRLNNLKIYVFRTNFNCI